MMLFDSPLERQGEIGALAAQLTPGEIRHCPDRGAALGGDKEWRLYAARAGLHIGMANYRGDCQPGHDRPRETWINRPRRHRFPS